MLRVEDRGQDTCSETGEKVHGVIVEPSSSFQERAQKTVDEKAGNRRERDRRSLRW